MTAEDLYVGTKSKGRPIRHSELWEEPVKGWLPERTWPFLMALVWDLRLRVWTVEDKEAGVGRYPKGVVYLLLSLFFGRPVSGELKCNTFHPLP